MIKTDELIIDWNLGLKLTGNNRELAEELINMLTGNLEKEVKKIRASFNLEKNQEMQKEIHRLHGAISYCGTPRLKKIISTLEIATKHNDQESCSILIDQLEYESNLLLIEYKNYKSSEFS